MCFSVWLRRLANRPRHVFASCLSLLSQPAADLGFVKPPLASDFGSWEFSPVEEGIDSIEVEMEELGHLSRVKQAFGHTFILLLVVLS